MSLYYETATHLTNADQTGGSLQTRIYKAKDLKNKPAHIYALASNTRKWAPVLSEVRA